jgi:hypothetical protein
MEDEIVRLKEIIRQNSKESEQDQIGKLLDKINELELENKKLK